jgi:PAS domain-containing protein
MRLLTVWRVDGAGVSGATAHAVGGGVAAGVVWCECRLGCVGLGVGGGCVVQQPIELILMRELADHLATPIFVVDPDGTLEFYNERAEAILGLRFEETGPMPVAEWASVFSPTDDAGRAMAPEQLPLVMTLRDRVASHGGFWIRGMDGATRRLEVTAVPLLGRDGIFVGAAALFWELPQ